MSSRARHPVVIALLARPARASAAVFLLSLVGAATVSLLGGAPLPRAHDETSYLLAADTYARGRLANPPHPHWEHFETPHVIHQPTYASKYQPGQGLVLALGQVLSGHALPGVWLGAAALAAAVTWMLWALAPARWALLGGVLTALQFGMAGVWAQSYWGGAVPATGAALLFGALARLRKQVSWPAGVALAAGSIVLALTRPFEGLVVFLFVVATLLLTRGGDRRRRIRVVVLSLAAAWLLGGSFTAVFNEAVTDDPLTMPYQLHTRQYGAAPLFVFQAQPEPPEYANPRVARFHLEWELAKYQRQRSIGGWISRAFERPVEAARDVLFGPPRNFADPPLGAWIPGVLMLPLLMAPLLWRRPRARWVLMVVVGLFACLSVATYFVPHYVAVLAPAWMYLVVQSLRLARCLAPAGPVRRAVVPLALSLSVVLVLQSVVDQAFRFDSPRLWYVRRARMEADLSGANGRDLVLVRYSPEWSYHWEWVYNSADIDAQEVVWARALDPRSDSSLRAYYPDRNAWSLEITPDSLTLEPVGTR